MKQSLIEPNSTCAVEGTLVTAERPMAEAGFENSFTDHYLFLSRCHSDAARTSSEERLQLQESQNAVRSQIANIRTELSDFRVLAVLKTPKP